MVRLESLTAAADPAGNRVKLSWAIPEAVNLATVLVKRRAKTYPESPDDGETVPTNADLRGATDSNLGAETVYYYMLFPLRVAAAEYDVDTRNRVAAMATAPEDFAGHMYGLLPAIYHRYDTRLPENPPPEMPADDATRGLLRRFVDLPAGQLDQLFSAARSMLDLHDIGKVHGEFLPRLADWIGWQTDYKLEYRGQRNELRNAPATYRSIGLIPTVEATVKRITDWESRSKEFVHNVFLSNQPERLNLWPARRDTAGDWSVETETPVSLDHSHDGRCATAIDANGVRWLFYHTQRLGKWEIWHKTSERFDLRPEIADELAAATVSARLQDAFLAAGAQITRDATITQTGDVWRIEDPGAETFLVETSPTGFAAYRISGSPTALAPSEPIGSGHGVEKYPTAASEQERLWLFWAAYDETTKRWAIRYRLRTASAWSAVDPSPGSSPFAIGGTVDDTVERTRPAAVVDDNQRLWLFWLERSRDRWELRYNRREPGAAGTWGVPVAFPLDAGVDPRVQSDLILVLRTGVATARLFVFWARQTAAADPASLRWEIAYRFKDDLELDDANWSTVRVVPKGAGGDEFHDREPSPIVRNDVVELFFSSNRGDTGWSIWNRELTDIAAEIWSAESRITDAVFSQRDATALIDGDATWLLFRSNRSMRYPSAVYGATETVDNRYPGSMTTDTRHAQKIALREDFDDIQAYSYDAGNPNSAVTPGNADWYARDTVGLYLDTDTLDEDVLQAGVDRVAPVLADFMPMTDHAVFIPRRNLHVEHVYTYSHPAGEATRVIVETVTDVLEP
jgi:hypothetical protein